MYKIKKHDRIIDEVTEFMFNDYESAKWFKMGHASFEDFYILLSCAEF